MSNEVEIRVTVKDNTKAATASAERNIKKLANETEKSASKTAAGVTKAEKKASAEHEKTMTKFAEKAKWGGMIAGAAILKIGFDAVSAASDAQQSLGGTEAVFGKFADTVKRTSKGAAEAVGLSANQYRESANVIGSLFKGQGVAADQLAKKTDNLIKFGADLSATYGGTAADAVEALTSAYKGEFDPIQRYGITIKQSTITTEAYAVAHVKTAKAFGKLSSAQQTAAMQQATTNLLMRQGKDAQGQFQSQSGTLAEQVQILKAKWTDLSAELGEKLIPVITKLLAKGIKLVAWLEKNPAVAQAAAIAIGALAAGFVALGVAMMANPVSLIVAGLVLLGAGLVMAYKKSEKFRAVVIAVFKATADVILGTVSAIIGAFEKLFEALGHIPGSAGKAFRSAAASAKNAKATVDNLRHSIDNLKSKKVNIRVNTTYAVYGNKGGHYEGGTFVPNKRTGGVTGHGSAATGGVRGGWTLVGEDGPEMAHLAPGSSVRSAGDTARKIGAAMRHQSVWDRAMTHAAAPGDNTGGSPFSRAMRSSSLNRNFTRAVSTSYSGMVAGGLHNTGAMAHQGKSDPMVLHFTSDGSRLADLLLELLRKSVRSRGGDVQLVLGGRSA